MTPIIDPSYHEYCHICLELNVSARGEDLPSVEKNLRDAIEIYLEDTKAHPETFVAATSTEDLIEFLRDTEPDWFKGPEEGFLLRPLEVHEVPSYSYLFRYLRV